MNLIVKNAKINDYFKFISAFFKLTPREYDVFESMAIMYLSKQEPFSIPGKKSLADQLGFNDYTLVNYYLKQFRDKGVVIKRDDVHEFNKLIFNSRQLPSKLVIEFEYSGKKENNQKTLKEIQPEL